MDTEENRNDKEIKQIRQAGYELSEPLVVSMPSQQSSQSLLTSIFKLIGNTPSHKICLDPHAPKSATVLNDKTIIINQSNKLVLLSYTIIEDKLSVQSKDCFLLPETILKVVTNSTKWFKKTQNWHFISVQLANCSLLLFSVDQQPRMVQLCQTKMPSKSLSIKFISQKQLIVVSQKGKLTSYLIKNKKLVQNQILLIKVEKQSTLKSVEICRFMHETGKIHIFITILENKKKRSFLNLLEFQRVQKQLCLFRTYEDIFESSVPQHMFQSLTIHTFQQAFLIQNQNNIWVLQHKFGKYLRADAISDLKEYLSLIVINREQHMFLCSIGAKQIELWELKIKDVGCKCHLLDVIEADGTTLATNMLASWIFIGNQRAELAFLTNLDSRNLNFYLTRNIDKMSKLIKQVKKVQILKGEGKYAKKEFKAKINQIQELGKRLGYEKKQFYLNLWRKNDKTSAHIYQYLLKSLDFEVIFLELEQYLREKTLTISQLVKILKTIEDQILKQLTKRLDIELILLYLKSDFQRRKLKLYSNQKKLDFAQYESINNMGLMKFIQHSIDLQLFPEKFHHNIQWKEQKIQTPLEIHYILREFRLIILEDYPTFLLKLLTPYGDCITKVLSTYYYLLPQYPLKISFVRQQLIKLSNIYPSQKISEDQHHWLGYISQYEWSSEQSSIHFLFTHLYSHYQTSFIRDKLKEFCNNPKCVLQRNLKYLLLESERKVFQQKLPKICEASSFLHLLEALNRKALQLDQQSETQSILNLMMQQNKLPVDQYHHILRHSKLQLLLIRQNLVERHTTINQLLEMSDIQKVRLFFLGEKAKAKLLFDKVATLYQDRKDFQKTIKQFIASDQCCKVELQILVRHMYTMKEQEIEKNMEILDVIIKGYLSRIEIRQIDKATDFLALFRQLPLSDELLIKMSVFQSVKTSCYPVLRQMGLGKLSYETVLSQVDTVIQKLVNNYFTRLSGRNISLYIQGRQIMMIHPQNLFVVVLYFKDKIYSFRQEIECYLSFGYALVKWNQFSLLEDCFGREPLFIDDQEMPLQQFYLYLVQYVIEKYCQTEEKVYDQETKQHLLKLLDLIKDDETLKLVEMAKLKFSEILQTLQFQVSLQYMETIKQQWKQGKKEERLLIFKEIVDKFIDLIDFDTFKEMYKLLEIMRLETNQISQKSPEMIDITHYICKQLATVKKYEQLCQTIYFLNQGEKQYLADNSIMTECLIQILSQEEADKKIDLSTSIAIIDYYLAKYKEFNTINQLFQYKLSLVDLESAETYKEIRVDKEYLKKPEHFEISRKQIWNIVSSMAKQQERSQAQSPLLYKTSRLSMTRKSIRSQQAQKPQKQLSNRQLLYIYFFICGMLNDSSFLLHLNNIQFLHQKNTKLLSIMLKTPKFQQNLYFMKILSNYMKGLFKIYYANVVTNKKAKAQQEQQKKQQLLKEIEEIQNKISKIEQFQNDKLIVLISELVKDKQTEDIYLPLRRLGSLFKSQCRTEIQTISRQILQIGKESTFKQKQIAQSKITIKKTNSKPLNESIQFNPMNQNTRKIYKFSQFQKLKNKYLIKSNITSEKAIAEKVLNDLEENLDLEDYKEVGSDVRYFYKKNQGEEKESRDDIELQSVLGDLKSQEENGQNDTMMFELYSIDCLDIDPKEYDKLKNMLLLKEYKTIKGVFQNRIIIKAINELFYNIEVNQIPKSNSAPTQKRLKKAQTLQPKINEEEITIIYLLEGLKELELSNNAIKIKLARQSLSMISTQELQRLSSSLIMIFRLNVLLDSSKKPRKIIKSILTNMQQMVQKTINLTFDSFIELVKVVDFFFSKCCEERRKTETAIYRQKQQESNHLSAMYMIYLNKLLQSEIEQSQKMDELNKIMRILGKQKLADIHTPILELLATKDSLRENYVLAIYAEFAGTSIYI